MNPKRISEKDAINLYKSSAIGGPVIVLLKGCRWGLFFTAVDPATQEPDLFTIRSQRHTQRRWSNVNSLCHYIIKHLGVTDARIHFEPENFSVDISAENDAALDRILA